MSYTLYYYGINYNREIYYSDLYLPGPIGATGADGPNNITTSTTTDLTGFLKGDGSVVSADNAVELSDLADVDSSLAPVDNSILKYNSTSSTWGSSTEYDKFELFTLDATDISNKYIELTGTVNDNQSIRVFLDNIGIKVEQGVDYSISGSQIFWTGYELASLLEVADKLKIFYI